jgi:hypothetical protein
MTYDAAIDGKDIRKNGIFFIIDALRYDIFADPEAARALAPNICVLADQGVVRRAVANAPATQFVLPSLVSQTYPLDYGGYNFGISTRPRSYAEQLQELGYSTQMMASCTALGITHGYERGFDGLHTAQDCRLILAHFLERNLAYEIERWQSGKISDAEAIEIISAPMEDLLTTVARVTEGGRGRIWPQKLRAINELVALRCSSELDLLQREPLIVLKKINSIPPILYWRYLGKVRPGPSYIWYRLKEAIRWRTVNLLAKFEFPFLPLLHFETKAHEIMDGVCEFVRNSEGPWSIHLHLMDVHDFRSVARPMHVVQRLRYLPRWLKARARGQTDRRFGYDSALMFLDQEFGKLLTTLRETCGLNKVVVLVTGDHAYHDAGSPRPKQNIAFRTHFEDIDIPMILFGADRVISDTGMIDSMGMNATYLEALDIPAHESFKGRSAFTDGRDAIISESAGSGNSDIENKDLYFTVSTDEYRMMSVLKGSELAVFKLYDRSEDPKELNNIVDDPDKAQIIKTFIGYIERERGEILSLRGYSSTTLT